MNNPSPENIKKELYLIASYKATGDLEVLGRLFNPYMHLVYGVCLKYLKDRDESQDMVMVIFEKLIESLKSHDVQNFKSWLYVMTKNQCLMKLRSAKYKKEQSVKDILDVSVENERFIHHNDEPSIEDDLVQLGKCIEELQNEQKRCVQLFYLEKKSYKEIEEITTYELKKVKSYIQNGKRNLKICLEKNRE